MNLSAETFTAIQAQAYHTYGCNIITLADAGKSFLAVVERIGRKKLNRFVVNRIDIREDGCPLFFELSSHLVCEEAMTMLAALLTTHVARQEAEHEALLSEW